MTPHAILDHWYTGDSDTPLIFGHRGAMAYAPMNTLEAFELCVEQGADGIELDVHLSKDGELVILHDFTIDHTTDSTGTVTEMTLAELKTLDAGSWFDEAFAGARIPTLSEVFEAVGDKLYINVEIKTLSEEGDGTEEAVMACIRKHDMTERVIVSSFNPYVLKRYRRIDPDMPIGYLLHPFSLEQASYGLLEPDDYDTLHYFYEMITDDELRFARQHGKAINTWTVNEVDVAKNLVEKGVRGIITNTPDVMVEALR